MIKVLRALGLELVVEPRAELYDKPARRGRANKRNREAAAMARRFTSALRTGDADSLLKVYMEMLRAQKNIAELSSRAVVARESLYRVFSRHPTPYFGTLVSVFNLVELRFSVRSLPLERRFQARLEAP
jgi:DNA-binding phage protein